MGIGGWSLEVQGSATDSLSHLPAQSSAASGAKAMAAAAGLATQGTTTVELPTDEALKVVDAIASSKFKAAGPNAPHAFARHAVSSVRFSSVSSRSRRLEASRSARPSVATTRRLHAHRIRGSMVVSVSACRPEDPG